MSTRSYIGYCDNGFKNITASYCHWDGYVEYNGMILNESYTTIEKVKKLVDGGDMSSLKENVEEIRYYKDENTEASKVKDFEEMGKYMSGIDYVYLFNVETEVWYFVHSYHLYEMTIEDLKVLSEEIARIEKEEESKE